MSIDYKAMGKRIRQLRKEKKLSQFQVAERAGFNEKYMSNIERGYNRVSLEIIQSICEVLDVSLDYLVNNKPNEENIEIIDNLYYQIMKLAPEEREILFDVIKSINNRKGQQL